MKITVIGTGYVGLIQAACLAEIGHQVTCLDIDKEKIALLKAGKSPIYEPGIEELVAKTVAARRLHFTTDYAAAIPGVEVAFIAVGTPSDADGRADLTYVKAAAASIAKHLTGYAVIVNKSTVPVGTGDVVSDIIREHYQGEFDVASNPEFLREGSAIRDFMEPDRIVIGNASQRAEAQLKAVYGPLKAPLLFTDIKTAELIKYASNAMLATQISFINSIAQICDVVGADVTQVAAGMKMDGRIGQRAFLNAGVGYGGSCFPKDVKALIQIAHDQGVHFEILEAVEDVNAQQRRILIERIRTAVRAVVPHSNPISSEVGTPVLSRVEGDSSEVNQEGVRQPVGNASALTGKRIALWGLAFKPETDDLREAPAMDVAQALIDEGATVVAYDPVAGELAKKQLPDLELADSPLAAAKDVDALAILTEWDEFGGLDLAELKKMMNHPTVIDGRNIYDLESVKKSGLTYHSIGRPAIKVDKE